MRSNKRSLYTDERNGLWRCGSPTAYNYCRGMLGLPEGGIFGGGLTGCSKNLDNSEGADERKFEMRRGFSRATNVSPMFGNLNCAG
jgi:hypothetical protein